MMPKIECRNVDAYYGGFHALKSVDVSIPSKSITSIIGPSGCGKSTLLRCFNRMNDRVYGFRLQGKVLLDDQDIYAPRQDLSQLRRRVGIVFQRPTAFPLSIYENVAFGLRIHGVRSIEEIVEQSLVGTDLWNQVKDKLQTNALTLSPEQQQRLCISRLIAVRPEVLLMDEPCSALDPIATLKIEDLMRSLASEYTIVIVTHNMQQAARVSDHTAFMLLGDLVEFGKTADVFSSPADRRTEEYVTGRYG